MRVKGVVERLHGSSVDEQPPSAAERPEVAIRPHHTLEDSRVVLTGTLRPRARFDVVHQVRANGVEELRWKSDAET